MSLWHLPVWAVLNGPRVRHDVSAREVLAEYLEWVRRTGGDTGRSEPRDDDESWDTLTAAELPPEAQPIEPPSPRVVFETVASAALELDRSWQEDVLATVPSQLLVGLSGLADRAVFLLEDAAPDLARRFEPLRDALMAHSDGSKPMFDEELARVVDELEASISAVFERAIQLEKASTPP